MLNKYCLNYRGYWFGGVEDVQRLRGKIVSLCPNDDVMYQESTHNLVAPNLLARPTNGSDAFDDKIIVKHIHRKDKRHRKKKGGKSFKNILLRSRTPSPSSNMPVFSKLNSSEGLRNYTKTKFKMVVYQVNIALVLSLIQP